MNTKNCIVIVGPTAVGKTSLSIQIARHYRTEIISADSRQCYRELNIGVAKPSKQQLAEVKHYFINSHSINDAVNARLFEEYACNAVEGIFSIHDFAIMVGGTGLYIDAFCNGIDDMPDADAEVRKQILAGFAEFGIGWLQDEVQKKDPVYFETGEVKNPRRLMRVLEIKLSTGNSILEYQKKQRKERCFRIIKIGLELSKEQLHHNIHTRVDTMMEEGLLDEVRSLLPRQNLPPLQTVGYTELFEYIRGNTSLEEAINKIKANTRHYAKRQLTWFRKDKNIHWIKAGDTPTLVGKCLQLLEAGISRDSNL